MAYKKQDILKALETITAPGEGKSLIESESVKNVVTFDKEIIVDVTIKNPRHRQVMDQKRSSSNCCLIETYHTYNHTERLCQCILSIETTS